jgi:hypothetical protein
MGRRITLTLAIVLILIGALSLLRVVGVIHISIGGLVGALVLVGIGAAVLWSVLTRPEAREIEEEEGSVALDGATEASVRVSHGAGRLAVDASAATGDLVTGRFAGGLDAKTKSVGGRLDVSMRPAAGFWSEAAAPWRWSRGRGLDWRFGLSRDIPLSLTLETGASDNRLDLSELLVTDLRISTGASSTTVTLPAHAGHTSVKLESGAASVKIRVPDGVAARIRVGGALSDTSVDRKRFPRSGGVYQSPDYETADNRADISIEMGVGSVSVR